ncbi:uncharacterized protein L969DRAFT_21074 [Mixia osmundae IAM 14324]|uniref:Uncharacterized protein n=1 Tax=Mixia osmundae (strain CBS 9802 / IAM 14324 / JCM 22182 / KY 12970) TaxID=764103 RepID=G7E016_MIXOS|nr:uncharacterized protein L969DRAFT_21074 [Mixia osmundae IAM 14324]KEI42169.1 hypothetical protein L969DRAFT_21074 [Mixia osmundae IAM 14324]GAA96176.1 hypothetical protein E5Q_02840 [Mixia osmundae IAM 14324]
MLPCTCTRPLVEALGSSAARRTLSIVSSRAAPQQDAYVRSDRMQMSELPPRSRPSKKPIGFKEATGYADRHPIPSASPTYTQGRRGSVPGKRPSLNHQLMERFKSKQEFCDWLADPDRTVKHGMRAIRHYHAKERKYAFNYFLRALFADKRYTQATNAWKLFCKYGFQPDPDSYRIFMGAQAGNPNAARPSGKPSKTVNHATNVLEQWTGWMRHHPAEASRLTPSERSQPGNAYLAALGAWGYVDLAWRNYQSVKEKDKFTVMAMMRALETAMKTHQATIDELTEARKLRALNSTKESDLLTAKFELEENQERARKAKARLSTILMADPEIQAVFMRLGLLKAGERDTSDALVSNFQSLLKAVPIGKSKGVMLLAPESELLTMSSQRIRAVLALMNDQEALDAAEKLSRCVNVPAITGSLLWEDIFVRQTTYKAKSRLAPDDKANLADVKEWICRSIALGCRHTESTWSALMMAGQKERDGFAYGVELLGLLSWLQTRQTSPEPDTSFAKRIGLLEKEVQHEEERSMRQKRPVERHASGAQSTLGIQPTFKMMTALFEIALQGEPDQAWHAFQLSDTSFMPAKELRNSLSRLGKELKEVSQHGFTATTRKVKHDYFWARRFTSRSVELLSIVLNSDKIAFLAKTNGWNRADLEAVKVSLERWQSAADKFEK